MGSELTATTSSKACYIKTQIRLMKGDEIAFGPGKSALLAAIAETGSISAAGRQMGMSYRRAWLLVETMNACFKEPLVISCKGGKHGGGAHLSPLGEQVLHIYQEMLGQVRKQIGAYTSTLSAFVKP